MDISTGPDSGISSEAVVSAFIEAASTTFRESAGTEIAPSGVAERTQPTTGDGLSAQLEVCFENGRPGCVLLELPDAVAAALAGRVLTGMADLDAELITDCAGELVNVIAGQAKTILSGTPEHFTISIPRVSNGPGRTIDTSTPECWGIDFVSDIGPFVLRVYLA